MQTEAATKANYTVKNIEVVAKGADIQARIFTLAPGEVIPWHRHSESTDHYFVLHGTLTINTRKPDNEHILEIGGRYKITPGTDSHFEPRGDGLSISSHPGRWQVRLHQKRKLIQGPYLFRAEASIEMHPASMSALGQKRTFALQ
jgi:mannose-6-phosphate isomerase-like protein (cupin superfamily)